MRIVNLKKHLEFLDSVIELGDRNSKTLGFFPRVAFDEQSRKGLIYIAIKDNALLGYLMFRKSYDRINIVHLCVDEKFRGQNTAMKLLSYLKENTKTYRGIRLKCRNDYNINKLWEKANFTPVKEQRGRSKAGHNLTIWWFQHKHHDLFSQAHDQIASEKKLVAIDTNIFIDLRNKREKESLALMSDWLLDEIELCISKEIYNDIRRNPDPKIREECRKFVDYFHYLEFDEHKSNEILDRIKGNFRQIKERDESDLKQIVNAINGDANYFITRDQYWIDQSDFFEKEYDITIKRPSVFITEVDELLEKTKYQPKRLAGTHILSEVISSKKVNLLIDNFYFNGHTQERKSEFTKKLNLCLANPKENEVVTISEPNGAVLGFFVINKKDKHKLKVPFIRTIKHNLSNTLIKHFLYKIIHIAIQEAKSVIQIEEKYLSIETENILTESNYIKSNNAWIKFSLNDVLTHDDLVKKLENYKSIMPEFENDLLSILNKINEFSDTENRKSIYYYLEKLLYPLKIIDNDIPCFVVPIKKEWATQLFEENMLGERLQFKNESPDLILNRENVYYRAARPKRLESPSRILWYISKSKNDVAFIAGNSFIDHIEIDLPKKLFKKYEQLGIYEWPQIYRLAKNDLTKNIMSFIFSDTELFKNKVALNQIRRLYKSATDKDFNPISPLRIPNDLYLKIYNIGKNGNSK